MLEETIKKELKRINRELNIINITNQFKYHFPVTYDILRTTSICIKESFEYYRGKYK